MCKYVYIPAVVTGIIRWKTDRLNPPSGEFQQLDRIFPADFAANRIWQNQFLE